MAGTMDSPTGLETVAHIFVADASDYYEIPDDGLPRLEGGGTASWFPTNEDLHREDVRDEEGDHREREEARREEARILGVNPVSQRGNPNSSERKDRGEGEEERESEEAESFGRNPKTYRYEEREKDR